MTTLSTEVTIDLTSYDRFQRDIIKAMRNGTGEFKTVYKQWAVRYRGFISRRFAEYSRGGGDWPPLKTPRKRGKLEEAAILRDTSTLFQATTAVFANHPGQSEQQIRNGIRVAIDGGNHPSGKLTVGEIAEIHQEGLGRNPKREIFVVPPEKIVSQMVNDARRGIDKMIKRYES